MVVISEKMGFFLKMKTIFREVLRQRRTLHGGRHSLSGRVFDFPRKLVPNFTQKSDNEAKRKKILISKYCEAKRNVIVMRIQNPAKKSSLRKWRFSILRRLKMQ